MAEYQVTKAPSAYDDKKKKGLLAYVAKPFPDYSITVVYIYIYTQQ